MTETTRNNEVYLIIKGEKYFIDPSVAKYISYLEKRKKEAFTKMEIHEAIMKEAEREFGKYDDDQIIDRYVILGLVMKALDNYLKDF